MQNLSAPFIFQEDCRMKIEHVLFPFIFFSKLGIRVSEGHSQLTKIGSLKTDRVNGLNVCIGKYIFFSHVRRVLS